MNTKQWLLVAGLVAIGTLFAFTAVSGKGKPAPFLTLNGAQQRVHAAEVTVTTPKVSTYQSIASTKPPSATVKLDVGRQIPGQLWGWITEALSKGKSAQRTGKLTFAPGAMKLVDGGFRNAYIDRFKLPALSATSTATNAYARVKIKTDNWAPKNRLGALPVDDQAHKGFLPKVFRVDIGGMSDPKVSEVSAITWDATKGGGKVADFTLIGSMSSADMIRDWFEDVMASGSGDLGRPVTVTLFDETMKVPLLEVELGQAYPKTWTASTSDSSSGTAKWIMTLSAETMTLSR